MSLFLPAAACRLLASHCVPHVPLTLPRHSLPSLPSPLLPLSQLICKFVVLCCIYASALPILYFLVAALLAIAPLVDRFNLLRRYPKTKDTDNSLARTAVGETTHPFRGGGLEAGPESLSGLLTRPDLALVTSPR